MLKVKELELAKKSLSDSYKFEIEKFESTALRSAQIIRDGYKIENTVCEGFIDFENELRIYVNKETGEVLKKEQMRPDDKQLKIKFLEDKLAR